jgi:hypothetical protein
MNNMEEARSRGWIKIEKTTMQEYEKFKATPRPLPEPELKVGMKCDWLMLPNYSKKRKSGYNPEYIPRSYFSKVEVLDVHFDKRFVKLGGRVAYGYKHVKWYSVEDIKKVNWDTDILRKFK